LSTENNGTGITLEWEKLAIRGEEMPRGLEYPDQVLFQALALLYGRHRLKLISREQAQREKLMLLEEYRLYNFRNDMEKQWVQMVKDTELLRAEYRKNPTQEVGMKLIAAIEGGKRCELSEPL
jgi:hypothetical protein